MQAKVHIMIRDKHRSSLFTKKSRVSVMVNLAQVKDGDRLIIASRRGLLRSTISTSMAFSIRSSYKPLLAFQGFPSRTFVEHTWQ